MSSINTLPIPDNISANPGVELRPTSIYSVDSWYRDIRPDIDMRSVPAETQLDAISSAVLLQTNHEVPGSPLERIREALKLTTDLDSLTRKLALAGPDSLILSDMVVELAESGANIPATVERTLFATGAQIAQDIRDNPLTPVDVRIRANAKLANVSLASLQAENKRTPGGLNDFSDRYIKTVRNEAQWMAKHSGRAPIGELFEVFIGSLAKYQVWVAGQDERLIARHATAREDMPKPSLNGEGKRVSHDVSIKSPSQKALLQCKWGPSAPDMEDRYDTSKVTFISETGQDGILATNEDFVNAFAAIVNSSDFRSAQECDRLVERYKLDKITSQVASATNKAVGYSALALTKK